MKIIFSKDNCPACDRIKDELKEKDESHIVLTVDTHFTRDDMHALFPDFKNHPYFPVVMEAKLTDDIKNKQSGIKKGNNKK